ncbi:hypothetical protein SAMN05421579_14328 [Xenorhabdus japonica]|uniref:Uncharacterized protein n=1 Tax=Xenorhabdus japonica TaxID=53341 RepID=A0A1I5DN19_9GAMM|nr:hypothetical protein SAMN05421579_14328 [Xenorhabdus japonica]
MVVIDGSLSELLKNRIVNAREVMNAEAKSKTESALKSAQNVLIKNSILEIGKGIPLLAKIIKVHY